LARCPLIRKCSEKVKFESYNEICSNITRDAYLECEAFKKATAGTKTPMEWDELVRVV